MLNQHRSEEPDERERTAEELPSIADFRRRLLTRIWRRIPSPLRVPALALAFSIAVLSPTHSYWFPPMKALISRSPKPFAFGVYIYSGENRPVRLVQILDSKGKSIASGLPDDTGFVTFSISPKHKITAIRCLDDNGSVSANLSINHDKLKRKSSFSLYVADERIEYP